MRTLVDVNKSAGSHSVVWDRKDIFGKDVTRGIYFFQLFLKGEYFKKTKKFLLLR